jgi:hypothetical protein
VHVKTLAYSGHFYRGRNRTRKMSHPDELTRQTLLIRQIKLALSAAAAAPFSWPFKARLHVRQKRALSVRCVTRMLWSLICEPALVVFVISEFIFF